MNVGQAVWCHHRIPAACTNREQEHSLPKLAYLVTEDWYFLSHRLPMARAARDAGFEVHVLTRVAEGRQRIEAEGFRLHALDWQRRDHSPVRLGKAVLEVRRLLQQIRPAVLHNIAVKPALFGSFAAAGLTDLAVVNSINGLGSGYVGVGLAGSLKRRVLGYGLVSILARPRTMTVVQNPEDRATLLRLGLSEVRLQLIAGSGVDTERLRPLPEPAGPVVAAYAGRLLADKGLRDLVAAHELLREQGRGVELIIAGTPDPENASSIPPEEVQAWSRQPGITCPGHLDDISALWARAHIAVLASRREGLPMSLLEASACGRPMVATDVPGCRDVVADGRTGLLVPLGDPAALAVAIGRLAADPGLRARLGGEARRRAEAEFSAKIVAAQAVDLYRQMASAAASSLPLAGRD